MYHLRSLRAQTPIQTIQQRIVCLCSTSPLRNYRRKNQILFLLGTIAYKKGLFWNLNDNEVDFWNSMKISISVILQLLNRSTKSPYFLSIKKLPKILNMFLRLVNGFKLQILSTRFSSLPTGLEQGS